MDQNEQRLSSDVYLELLPYSMQASFLGKSFHFLDPFYLCTKFRRIKCLFINLRQDLDQKKALLQWTMGQTFTDTY